ncbi:MAG: hypothetical protein DWQ02_02870 [Bacteroidetes bacterium]|nr:MAG: hypothetical protein DWQ02_02870 [Bacteroidota bacterium]
MLFCNLVNIYCQEKIDYSNIKKVELFLLQSECRNPNSYNKFQTEYEQKTFFNKFKSSEDIPNDRCEFYIDLENCEIQLTPFLNTFDIEKFDWNSSKIVLTKRGIEKLKILDVPLNGSAFVLKLNQKIIYGGWFWNRFSSIGCDRIWTWQHPDENELKLRFGLGGFKCGTDSRIDKRLIDIAIESGK